MMQFIMDHFMAILGGLVLLLQGVAVYLHLANATAAAAALDSVVAALEKLGVQPPAPPAA
jgi:hypothetical protein